MELSGKKVTVAGIGLHGGALGTIQWLHQQGAIITATDLKTKEELAPTLDKLSQLENITYVLGEHREEDFTNADLIVRNPGMPATSQYLQAAESAGIPIEMDSSLFFLHCPSKHIIGVTGSKGKTTTAKAITEVLRAAGKDVIEVGTDGASPLGRLDAVTKKTIVVFELSSWRLEALKRHKVSPQMAVVTSLLPDHLNTYESMDAYEETKKGIVAFQNDSDIAILNYDDPKIRQWSRSAPGKVLWYSAEKLPDNHPGIMILDHGIVTELTPAIDFSLADSQLPVIGTHAKRNILPAILIGLLEKLDEEIIVHAVQNITPLPHRLEIVGEKDDVTFVNNSAATIPDATIAALDAYEDASLVLILGGSDKKLEFEELGQRLMHTNIRALIWLPGNATQTMKHVIEPHVNAASYDAESMQDAVSEAKKLSHAGDVVLLSPGATSFGLFKHEFDRGDQFRAEVKK